VLQYLQTTQMHSCAYVLKNVPPLGDFLVGNMALDLGLDRGTNANGCCICRFMFPLIPMDVD
jgi:hypothetical protein